MDSLPKLSILLAGFIKQRKFFIHMRIINEIGEDIYEISRNKKWKMRVRLGYSIEGGYDNCEIRNYCARGRENICVILGITNPNQVFKRDDKVDRKRENN